MDGREAMASYYMQRGMGGSGSGTQTGLPGQGGIRPLLQPGSSVGSTFMVESSPRAAIPPHTVNMGGGPPATLPLAEPVMKRKRGRPRKYGSDGTVSLALSPTPSSTPGSVSGIGSGSSIPLQKRGRGRPPGSGRKQQLASLGEWLSGSAGMGFTPHIITIPVGEDIATKIMSFSQQGPRAVCILSANGAVSTVTLRQPASSGGTVTYEGRFEILCLSGSYLLTDDGGSHNRTGGLSVSLSSPDGRVIGGGVGGMLIAATPVQRYKPKGMKRVLPSQPREQERGCQLDQSRQKLWKPIPVDNTPRNRTQFYQQIDALSAKQTFTVMVGSFIYGGTKAKSKSGMGPESGVDSPHAIGDHQSATPTSMPPGQNLTPSAVSGWLVSRPMDVRSAQMDIDLTRG